MSLLAQTYFHIIPQLNIDGVKLAVNSDCNGTSYGGTKLDDKFNLVSGVFGGISLVRHTL